MSPSNHRRPVSVLVVVYTDDGYVLLLRRSKPFDFWQSVTGSLNENESPYDAAVRELVEETGLTNEGTLTDSGVTRTFEIDPRWRDRFEPGVTENVEYEWRYRLPARVTIELDEVEHSEFCWLPVADAIEKVWSWTNREALQLLTQ